MLIFQVVIQNLDANLHHPIKMGGFFFLRKTSSSRSRWTRIQRIPWCVGWLLIGLLGGWSCKSTSRTQQEIHVYAASSLLEALQSLKRHFESKYPHVQVVLTFAGSQVLRLQIEQGAKADVFISANTKHTQQLVAQRLLHNHKILGYNELVLIVPRQNPGKLQSFRDLSKAKRLVIGTPHVPIGAYTRQLFQQASKLLGHSFVATIQAHVVSEESNVRLVRGKVELGEADAAIVYRTDALASKRVKMITIPAPFNTRAQYEVGVVKHTRSPQLTAAWMTMLFSPEGKRMFQQHGFRSP